MKIECFVKKDFMTINPFSGINVVKNELLNQKAVVVSDKEKYIGTLTATDILQRPHNLVIDCMSEKQQITTNYTTSQTLQIMKERSTDVLPVYKNDNFYGLVYKNDLLEYLTGYTNELSEKVKKKTEEIKQLTENLENLVIEKTQELQKLNATKDKFFSIIAHDLRSPFNTILGFSKILKENAKDYTLEEIEGIFKSINTVSQQTYELLENLLQWSMAQRNQIAFNPEKFNLNEFAQNNMRDLESFAKSKEIELFYNIPNSISVFADANMLKTILRNLISNSIKFTKKNGSVYIESSENGDFTKIFVIDTGIGMNKSKINELFRIEKQNSTYGTNNEKGSGLGLIICKEFIEKHGGEISIDSEEGKGSSFVFTIPKKAKEYEKEQYTLN